MAELFTLLRPGRKVKLRPWWAKFHGFTTGEILECLSPMSTVGVDGGYYRIRKLDPDDKRTDADLTPDMHRTTFVPVSNSIGARLGRIRKAKDAARTAGSQPPSPGFSGDFP